MSLTATIATAVIPALLPAVTDGFRAVINRFARGAQKEPVNFEERLELQKLDLERLRTLAELDSHNNAKMPWWVDAIKTLQRPFFGVTILSAYIAAIIIGAEDVVILDLGDYVSMFGFYLFGERFLSNRNFQESRR